MYLTTVQSTEDKVESAPLTKHINIYIHDHILVNQLRVTAVFLTAGSYEYNNFMDVCSHVHVFAHTMSLSIVYSSTRCAIIIYTLHSRMI